jgi:menaquinone-9 beta-reductase
MDDVVIIGGGIAGSALALVLARGGLAVTVLERQRGYRDRVRGEFMSPWGVACTQRLGIFELFLRAGAVIPRWQIPYEEGIPPTKAESARRDVAERIPGVPGPLCASHPRVCQELNDAAAAAGARIVRGTGPVVLSPGPKPQVTYRMDGQQQQVDCRLIVGADGRSSAVRKQLGIGLRQQGPTHMVAGLLVAEAGMWGQDTYTLGAPEGDLRYCIIPQGQGRLRLYLTLPNDRRNDFTGSGGAGRFLAAFRFESLDSRYALWEASPIGPCATFGADDTWTDAPIAESVVLIGDAAGCSDPAIGQGLSLAVRDVEVLAQILLSERTWTTAALEPYALERGERARRVRFTATTLGAVYYDFSEAGRERRQRLRRLMRSGDDPGIGLLAASIGLGPDATPDFVYEESFRRKILAS